MRGVHIFSAIVILAVAYYVYEPLPPNWSDPWKTRGVLTLQRSIAHIVNAGGLLGRNTIVDTRNALDSVLTWVFSKEHLNAVVQSELIEIEGIKVRLYENKATGKKADKEKTFSPGLVYFHGGGWTIGSTHWYDGMVKRLVKDTGTVAISVEYRLAPEHPFPAAYEDCVAATKYFLTHAASYGVDASRVVLAGDSAGGNLAAAVSMRLYEEGFEIKPKLQALIYPAIQGVNLQSPSYQANKNGPWLTHDMMGFFYANYAQGHLHNMTDYLHNQHVAPAKLQQLMEEFMPLDALPDDDIMKRYNPSQAQAAKTAPSYWSEELENRIDNPFLSPLFAPAEIFAGQPSTYISACQYDVLRDDSIWYAHRLRSVGVSVTLDVADCVHAYCLFSEDVQSADKLMQKYTDFIRENL